MAVIERDGVQTVSQRTVATEADVPPSAVTYYFPTVDDLLVAALTDANDDYMHQLAACAEADEPIAALAELIAASNGSRRRHIAAEYELFISSARRPLLRAEMERWTGAMVEFLARHVPHPVRRAGVAAAVDGLFLRCFCDAVPPDAAEVHAILHLLVHGNPAPDR